jgi:hypothetical protein
MHMGGAAEKVVVFGDEPSALGQEGPLGAALFFEELPPLKAPVTLAIRATTARMTTATISVRRRDCRLRAAAMACCWA